MTAIGARGSTIVFRALACLGVLALLAHARSALAEEADCKPLFAAMSRMFHTPNHQYLTQTSAATGDKSTASEIINTGNAMYIMVDGKWHNSNATGTLLEQQEEDNRRKAKVTSCKLVHEESLNGVTVKLFNAHTETEYGASEEQLWVAKSSELPVREIIDMDLGDHGGKSRAEIRVEYVGIQAPPGLSQPQ